MQIFRSLLPKQSGINQEEIPFLASLTIPSIDKERQKKTQAVVVSAFPKSGSTYLTRLLSEMTGNPLRHLVQFYQHNEQDLCEIRLIRSLGMRYVVHQHIKGTENNLILMRKYGIRPVVLVRNIFDVLYSLRDHIKNEDHKTPICYVHKQYFSMDENEKLSYLVRSCIPWYLSFYVSWLEASKKIDTYWLTYEDLFSSRKGKFVFEIMDFNGLSFDKDVFDNSERKIGSINTRLNFGRSGRGKQLSIVDRDAVFDMARAWRLPSGAFVRIGIDL